MKKEPKDEQGIIAEILSELPGERKPIMKYKEAEKLLKSILNKRRKQEDQMRELEKKLKALQKQGYEQINIIQVLNWMYYIKRENTAKRIERRKNER